MFEYYYTATVNPSKLNREIKSDFPWLALSTSGASITISSTVELSVEQKETLDYLVVNHTTDDLYAAVKNSIVRATAFGQDMMAEYATKRVLRGATIEDTTSVLSKLSNIQSSLSVGSLYVALNQLGNLQPDDEIPQEDIDEFIQKISAYLGL